MKFETMITIRPIEIKAAKRDDQLIDTNEMKAAAAVYASAYPAYNNEQDIAEKAFKAGVEWKPRE